MNEEDKSIKNPKYPYKKPEGIQTPERRKPTLRSLLPKKNKGVSMTLPTLPKLNTTVPKLPDMQPPPPNVDPDAAIMKILEKIVDQLELVLQQLSKRQ
jgi:hypothetical protein